MNVKQVKKLYAILLKISNNRKTEISHKPEKNAYKKLIYKIIVP